MRIALLIWIPLLFGGWFHSCVESRPPKQAQADPGFFSRRLDPAWRSLASHLISEVQGEHARLEAELLSSARRLPPGSVDLPALRDRELKVEGTYGQLPEVLVDQDPGAIFPAPLAQPQRFSWFQTSGQARESLLGLARFEKGFRAWQALSEPERIRRFGELAGAWEELDSRIATLARHSRYLDTWVPQLSHQWVAAASGGTKPVEYLLTSAIQAGDPGLTDALAEVLKPKRVIKRPFLPEELEPSVVTVPIATDVSDRRFLAEVAGALSTHWSQSTWAREQGVTFKIEWTRLARDDAFARGRITLEEHLAKFPQNRAGMTTGGLTTYVRGQTLVLGPGKINPRTLAHELGHLLGFGDCYLRTLSGQGFFGTAVLEWDNPLYPDDLMCDNTVGAARAEVW
jgi:hypothetical protein